MSALDLTKIAIALGSSKIKDRNDALTLLEELSNSQTTINSKSFKILGSAIFDAVEREIEALNKTVRQRAGPATTRIERMSTVLRCILEKSFMADTVVRLKFRNYLDVVLGVLKYFKLGMEGLNSTMDSLIRVFNLIISKEDFLCHLSYREWDQIFSFVVTGIENSIDLIQQDQFNVRLLSQFLTSLCNLLNCSNNISINSLHLFTNGNYRRLKSAIIKSANIPRLGQSAAITLMKIINKVIIVFCTEEIAFVHDMLLCGMELVLLFNGSNLDELWKQFAIFLNSNQFHCFLDPSDFKEADKQDLDLVSPIDDETDQSMIKITYKLKVLILKLLSLLEETSSTIKPGSLKLKYHTNDFVTTSGLLMSVYLANGQLNTFLLISSVARLVDTYYSFKEKYDTAISEEEDSLLVNGSFLIPNKRRKISTGISSFQSSNTSLQFLRTLLGNKNDSKSVVLGLQLVLMQSEYEIIKFDTYNTSSSKELARVPSSGDSSYDFSILLSDSFTKKSLLVELLDLIEVLDFREWAFICCRSLLFQVPTFASNNFTDDTLSSFCIQLMHKSITYANEFDVAADTVYACTKLCTPFLKQQDLTPAIVNLLENIDSKGPRNLSSSSFHFWYGCNLILSRSSANMSLSDLAQEWLISKMMENTTNEYLYSPEFALFVQWLSGHLVSIPLEVANLIAGNTISGLHHLGQNCNELFCYISRGNESNSSPSHWDEVPPISSSTDPGSFLLRLLHVPRISLHDSISLIRWSFVLAQLATCMAKDNIKDSVFETIESYAFTLVQEANIETLSSEQAVTYARAFPLQEWKKVSEHYRKNYVFEFHSSEAEKSLESLSKALNLSRSALDFAFDSDQRLESPTPSLESHTVVSELELLSNPLTTLLQFKLVCIFVGLGVRDSNHIIDFLKNLTGIEYAICIISLMKEIENGVLTKHVLELSLLTNLIQGVGTKLLASTYDRYELTQILVCRLSSLFLLCYDSCNDNTEEFSKFKLNCEDIFEWIRSSYQKGHFRTESALSAYFSFSVGSSESSDVFLKSFCEDLEPLTNNLRVRIKDCFPTVLNNSKYPMSYYRDLYSHIGVFLNTLERAISSCLLLSWVGVHVHTISCASLFNLLEGTKNLCLQPYISSLFKCYIGYFEVESARDLFGLHKRELLTYWCHFNDIYLFPFGIMGYDSINQFLSSNATELMAIDISTEKKMNSSKLIEDIVALKQTDEYSLIVDSIPLILPFAYTRNGIRNKIFDSLKTKLGSNSKTEISGKLNFAIYQIILYTNISKEQKIIDGIQSDLYSENSIELEDVGSLSITLSTSLDLMSTLILKFSSDKSGYWTSPAVVHFLLRRVLATIKKSFSLSLKISLIRRVKLILQLAHKCRINFTTTIEVVCQLMTLINNKELIEDIYRILIHLTKTDDFVPNQALQLSVAILGGLLENENPNTKEYATLLLNIESYLNSTNRERLIHKVLEVSLAHLKFKQTSLSSSLVEEFISKEMTSFSDTTSRQQLIKLLSAIFIVVNDDENAYKSEVAEFLMSFDEETIKSLSPNFIRWRTLYLGKYYLKGRNIHELTMKNEVEFEFELTAGFFIDYSSTLNSVVERIVHILKKLGNSADSICAESVLSVLIWKTKHNKKDFGKFLNFEEHCKTLKEYIVPLDFHSCMLINSEDQDMEYDNDTFVEQMHNSHYLQKLDSNLLSQQLCLFILEKISSFTSIAPLISICVLRIPNFAINVFAYLLMFTVNAFGCDGVHDVLDLFLVYLNIPSGSLTIKKMISDAIIMARYGAKQEYPTFIQLYEKIDLVPAIMSCIETKSFRMALILLEDAHLRKISIPEESILKIYESIDNSDMIFGSFESPNDRESIIRLISLANQNSSRKSQYSSAQYDAMLYFGKDVSSKELLNSLLSNGMMGISRALSKWEPGENSSREWGWKLNRWELPTHSPTIAAHPKYDELMYGLLHQVSANPISALEFINNFSLPSPDAKENTKLSIKETETKKEEYLRYLGVLLGVKDILLLDTEDAYSCANNFSKETSWFADHDLQLSEDILIARRNALRLLLQTGTQELQVDKDVLNLCSMAEVVRYGSIIRSNSNDSQKITNSTMLLLEFLNDITVPGVDVVVKFNTALSLWEQGMSVESVNILRGLLKDEVTSFPIEILCISKSLINATLAEWLAESRQDLPSSIMSKYIEPTLLDLEHTSESGTSDYQLVTIYRKFAQFCQTQYSSGQLLDQISLVCKRLDERKKEIDELKDHYGKNLVGSEEKRLAQRYYARLKQEFQVEHDELKKLRRLKETFAIMATQLYLKSVHVNAEGKWSVRDDFDKFFSFWFENKNRSSDSLINKLVCELPSKYFCDWASQLVSRLEGVDATDEFQMLLLKVILKVSSDLPYHMLYPLMSLRISGLYEGDVSLSRKSVAADKIWRTLILKENVDFIALMQQIDLFCNESVKLAEFKGSKGRSINLDKLGSSGLSLSESKQNSIGDYWLKNLPQICPPTLISAYMSPTLNIPTMVLIKSKVSVAASGLSLPKVATFVLSDGTEHKMLFKHGSDDLRQDSIMEQVFAKVNLFLNANKETRKRNLRIRTYNAVPLGPKSGIIEFVNNTSALVDILKPLHDAHDQYKMDKCRDLMRQVQSRDKAERVLTYQRITEKCTPKLHYFFMSEFGTPDSWFECLLNYTHGVAVTSFVGYIVGLGDRHCNNILIDKLSGEPVHIDLGVAFDQGKLLTVPETVPFRLTRDMVAGLGINGTKGVFTRASEHVFRVLLENKDHIMTILDVLKWDPLYSWSLSPLKRRKLQDGNGTNLRTTTDHKRGVQVDGYEAQRAINTVHDKLTGSGLSVEATVRQLIQDATNPENLALIYWGWSPFY